MAPELHVLPEHPPEYDPDAFVGTSENAREVREMIDMVGSADCNLTIAGPTGSGKRVVLRALQRSYAIGHLIRIMGSQLDGDIMRGEIIGQRAHSFTDAKETRLGLAMQPEGGILAVDDSDDTPMRGQKLLLDIAEHEPLWMVGGGRSVISIMRVAMLVQSRPAELVKRGLWRDDLRQRVTEEEILLAPLAQRMEDVPLLVDHFARELTRKYRCTIDVEPAFLDRLMALDWPGNVRELYIVLKRAHRRARYHDGDEQEVRLRPRYAIIGEQGMVASRHSEPVLDRVTIEAGLEKRHGIVAQVARDFQVCERTLRRRMDKLDIDYTVFRQEPAHRFA